MKKVKRTVEVIDYVADDGTVFPAEINMLEAACKLKEDYYYHWKEYNEATWDESKLVKYQPENWEHFKWFILKNVIRSIDNNYNYRRSSIYDPDIFNKWKDGEDLRQFLKSLFISNIDQSNHNPKLYNFSDLANGLPYMNYLTIKNYKVLFSSGLLDIHSIRGRSKTLLNCLKDLHIRCCELSELKFLCAEYDLKFCTEDLEDAMRQLETSFYEFTEHNNLKGKRNDKEYDYNYLYDEGKIFKGGSGKDLAHCSGNKYHYKFEYFYTKETKDLLDFMLSKMSNYDALMKDLLQCWWTHDSQWSRLDYLYKWTKKNNIKSIYHKEKIEDIITFHYYCMDNITLNKEKDDYVFRIEKKNIKLKLPSLEVFEAFLGVYCDKDPCCSHINQVNEMIELYPNINRNVVDYWLFSVSKIRLLSDNGKSDIKKKYLNRYNDIRKYYENHSDFDGKHFGGCYGWGIDIKGDGNRIDVKDFGIKDKMDIEYLRKKWIGRKMRTNHNEIVEIFDVTIDTEEKYGKKWNSNDDKIHLLSHTQYHIGYDLFCEMIEEYNSKCNLDYCI